MSQSSPTPPSGPNSISPIVSFDATSLKISVVTNSYLDANAYDLTVKGGYTILSSIYATVSFTTFVIAPIITTPIASITYTVGNTPYIHVFDPFYQQQSTTGITFSYYLETSTGGSPLSIFTFNGQQQITVSTSNNGLKSVYNLRVRASFDSISLTHSDVYSYFTVTVQD